MSNISQRKHLRNKDLIPQDKLDSVTVVGLGGIGSGIVMLLSIMGFKHIRGYDDDIMEEHNFGTTLYAEDWYTNIVMNNDNSKANMADHVVKSYGGSNIESEMLNDKFLGYGQVLSPKTIVCTDDMDSRKLVYENWLEYDDREVLIDLRMDALTMSCITTTKNSDVYMKHWFPPGGSGEEAPCTMKHTIFCANLIAGLGVSQLFNFLTKRPFYQYIWQGLSPLDMRMEDFHSGEDNEINNHIITEEYAYAN